MLHDAGQLVQKREEKQKMKLYISEICRELEFPQEAAEAMLSAWDALEQCGQSEVYRRILAEYEQDYNRNLRSGIKEVDEAAAAAKVNRYTAELLLFLLLTRPLRIYYENRGIPMEIWHDSCMDLHWKLMECRQIHGVWGSFVAWWFPGFFDLTRFALGRFQFELIDFPAEYEASGRTKPEGMTRAINVHIPSCGPLKREECLESYHQAAEFFADAFPGENVAFCCESWLLFEPHREFLAADSGIVTFMNDYDIVLQEKSDDDLWRVFHCEYHGEPETLPEDTQLQKAYKAWLAAGKEPGYGYGIFYKNK